MKTGLKGVKKDNTPYLFDMRSLSGIQTAGSEIIPYTEMRDLSFSNGFASIDSNLIPSVGETVIVTTNEKTVNATCTFSDIHSTSTINAYPVVVIDDDELDFYIEFSLMYTYIHQKNPSSFSTVSVKVESATIMPSMIDVRASGCDLFPCIKQSVSGSFSGYSRGSFTFADGMQMIVDIDGQSYVCPLQYVESGASGHYSCGADETQESIDYDAYPFKITFEDINEDISNNQYATLFDYSITYKNSESHMFTVYAIVSPYDYMLNQKMFSVYSDDVEHPKTLAEVLDGLSQDTVHGLTRFRHFRWSYKSEDPSDT